MTAEFLPRSGEQGRI